MNFFSRKNISMQIYHSFKRDIRKRNYSFWIGVIFIVVAGCGKKSSSEPPPSPPAPPSFISKMITIDGKQETSLDYDVNRNPLIKFSFSTSIDKSSVPGNLAFNDNTGTTVAFNASYSNGDSIVIVQPSPFLNYFTKYAINVSSGLKSKVGGNLKTPVTLNFITQIDSSDKFPRISDDDLFDLVQKRTFKYFYDFGHPVSGMARERNTSADVVTTGGTGFGVMSIIAGINRNFIARAEGLQRINKL